jgi:hypothetical protein
VIGVDSEVAVPDAVATTPAELAATLVAAVESDLVVSPATPDLGFVHRRCGGADVYFLANTGPTPRVFTLTARADLPWWAEWDPRSGEVLRTGAVADGIAVTLHPYASTVVVLADEVPPPEPGPGRSGTAPAADPTWSVSLDRGWQVAFGGGPPEPVELPHVWEDQPGRRHYSGEATYAVDVELDAVRPGDRVVLDLGTPAPADQGSTGDEGLVGPSYRAAARTPVGDVARVRVNGVDCGVLWAPPFRVELTTAVRPGSNRIEVVVANTAANAVAADEHIVRLAAESEARYGRRFRMQELDRAMDTVRSGLLQVPVLLGTRD